MSKSIKIILFIASALLLGAIIFLIYLVHSNYNSTRQLFSEYLQNEPLLTVYTRDDLSEVDAQQLSNLKFSFADGYGVETDKPKFSMIVNGENAQLPERNELWININVRDLDTVLDLDPKEVEKEIVRKLEENGFSYDGINDVLLLSIQENVASSRFAHLMSINSYIYEIRRLKYKLSGQ